MDIVFEETFQSIDIDKRECEKLMQAIDVHGYRGASKKRHNGVVPIRPVDARLIKTLNKLLTKFPHLQDGFPVKVVAHVPTGNRLIGVIKDGCLHILGVEHY